MSETFQDGQFKSGSGKASSSQSGYMRNVKELFAGGVAGSVGIVVGLPFDLVKVRMQTNASSTSALQVFKDAINNDGFASLWRGTLAPVVATFITNGILFATEAAAMRVLQPDAKSYEEQKFSNQVLAGMIGGFTQCVVLTPLDRIKCLVQADGAQSVGQKRLYTGTFDCGKQIMRTEGVPGMFKGFWATAVREVPSFAIYFSSYKYMRGVFDKHTNHTMSALAAGSFAGTMSWGVVYPFDVIKTEIQAGTGGTTSISQVCKNLYKESGYKAFFRGIGPTLVRAVPVNGITFLCYEKMKMSMEF